MKQEKLILDRELGEEINLREIGRFLKKNNIIGVNIEYSGCHDDGGVDEITLTSDKPLGKEYEKFLTGRMNDDRTYCATKRIYPHRDENGYQKYEGSYNIYFPLLETPTSFSVKHHKSFDNEKQEWEYEEVEYKLADVMEMCLLDCLPRGWEIGDGHQIGSYGEFLWDIDTNEITCDHNTRYEDSEPDSFHYELEKTEEIQA